MSILRIGIIASKARLAAARSGLAMACIITTGVLCHESPHVSRHQPHRLSSPPFPTMASQYRSVSAWSCVATWNEKASVSYQRQIVFLAGWTMGRLRSEWVTVCQMQH